MKCRFMVAQSVNVDCNCSAWWPNQLIHRLQLQRMVPALSDLHAGAIVKLDATVYFKTQTVMFSAT